MTKLFFENVDFSSTSGPNHFATKLANHFIKNDATVCNNREESDGVLCFIESYSPTKPKPMVQRLDGIYFNIIQDYNTLNKNIKRTYDITDGVVFQSQFSRDLIFHYFGEHNNYEIIHNGADFQSIESVPSLQNKTLDQYENVWCCASNWRPLKRLNENIRYFLEHSGEKDCLVIAGNIEDEKTDHERIFYVGNLQTKILYSLYKRSQYFIHLGWFDNCPNVVVDARASGCKIICSSLGGTKEIAGSDATIIEDIQWDMQPLNVYDPPKMDFTKSTINKHESILDVNLTAQKYLQFINKVIK